MNCKNRLDNMGLDKSIFLTCAKLFVLTLIFGFVSGCVSHTESPFTRKQDKEEALTSYIQLGLAYIERGDLVRARKHLNRALELDSESSGAHAALGLVLQREGEYRLAEEQFKKSLENEPGFTRGRTYYAAFLYSQQRYQQAYDQFAIAADDTGFVSRDRVFSNMAQCALKLERADLAIAAYEKSLSLGAQDTAIFLQVAELLVQEGRFNEAQRYYNRFLNLVRTSPVTHSAQSLSLGIQLAEHFQDTAAEQSYASILKAVYADSLEYQQYRDRNDNE